MPIKDITSLIIRHTVISRSHLTPEIGLRLITPACELWTAPEGPFKDPFWAFYWPGGQATARYILDNPNKFSNRSILDVGCGCGASSIAAAKVNAKRIVANDIDRYAVTASYMNAEINQVLIETNTNNMIGQSCQEFDTVLIGDMFYDADFANLLFDWLLKLRENGKSVMIGDPGRHGLSEHRRNHIKKLAKYRLPEESCVENNGFTETFLWEMN